MKRFLLSVGLLFGVLLCLAPASGQPTLGMNYSWWRFIPTPRPQCRVGNTGDSILGSYDDREVRRVVEAQLRQMHNAGFSSLRFFVWHRRPVPASSSGGWFFSEDGSIVDADRVKLRNLVRDIAAAGFTSLEVGPNFVGQNWIYCTRETVGDCFEPSSTEENWKFIEQVARTVLQTSGSMSVRFDLMNEGAPSTAMPQSTQQHAKVYLQQIAQHFQAEFGRSWLISAPDNLQNSRAELARTRLLIDDLAEVGLAPRFLELHEYNQDSRVVTASLDFMQSLSKQLNARVVVGELLYHSTPQAEAIHDWLARTRDSRVIDLFQWPGYEVGPCQVSPPPPYDPGPLRPK